jgi:murein DD-endopeptidase MepM/ murein hydrolase activator NlpD
MLFASAFLLLDAMARPVFDDDTVVAFHMLAMARPELTDAVCRFDLEAETSAIELAYDAGTPVLWDVLDAEDVVLADLDAPISQYDARMDSAPGHPLPFAPLAEPVFETDVTPFVMVKNEAGEVVSSGWMTTQRGDVAWLTPLPRRRAPIGPPLFEEYLNRLDRLRQDPHVLELEREGRDGTTLARTLDDAALERGDLGAWLQAIGESGEISPLEGASRRTSLFLDKRDRTLRQLSVDLDDETMLVAMRRGSTVVADRVPIPYQSRIKVAGGEIHTTLYLAAMKAQVPEATVAEIAEILGWELDFGTLRRGATFRVAYEEIVRLDTGARKRGRVLAVDVTDLSRTYEAYWFAKANGGEGAYYARDGRPLGGMFLRYPVAYTRISSFFSDARFHPIKKRNVPHYGVDFAAPTGSPVVASGDGTVVVASWQGGNGRLIKIRHDKTYESAYAHLSRIAAGIVPGAKVRQGQVIGYVGSSGLATGPHLHYAVYRDGRYVDPLKVQLGRKPPEADLPTEEFQVALERVDDAYDRAGLGRDAVVQVSMAHRPR